MKKVTWRERIENMNALRKRIDKVIDALYDLNCDLDGLDWEKDVLECPDDPRELSYQLESMRDQLGEWAELLEENIPSEDEVDYDSNCTENYPGEAEDVYITKAEVTEETRQWMETEEGKEALRMFNEKLKTVVEASGYEVTVEGEGSCIKYIVANPYTGEVMEIERERAKVAQRVREDGVDTLAEKRGKWVIECLTE